MERVADYVIRKVSEHGVGHIFFISGRGILYLTDAVAKNPDIMPVSTYHEQGASYAAMAYSRVKHGMSVCLVSTGCGSTNAITACLCAFQDNLPVVFISGNNPLNENVRHTGAKIRTYGSQEADIIRVVEPITKYAVMLESAEQAVFEVEKALCLALEGRRGPVWIDIPLDVQNMRVEEEGVVHFSPGKVVPEVSDYELELLETQLNQSERPVLLVGGGAEGAKEYVARFAMQLRIPVVLSPTASDLYGAYNDLSFGTVGSLGGTRYGNLVIQNSDFVLAVGTKLCSQLTGDKTKFARNAKIFIVDIDENEHTKDGVRYDCLICSDANVFFRKLETKNLRIHSEEWICKCKHWKKQFAISNEEFVKELKKNNKLDIYILADELNDVLPSNATVITDAGFEELIIPAAIHFRDRQICLFPAAQGAMGYAIPAIIGAYFAGRENICCIVGDGSAMMNLQELQLIAVLQIPVKIVIVNNNMYAVIRKRQKDLFRNRTIGNDPSDGVAAPDYERIAACFGIAYRKIFGYEEYRVQKSNLFDGIPEIIEVMCITEQEYYHESYAINDRHKLVHRPIEDMAPFISRELIRREMIVDMMEE